MTFRIISNLRGTMERLFKLGRNVLFRNNGDNLSVEIDGNVGLRVYKDHIWTPYISAKIKINRFDQDVAPADPSGHWHANCSNGDIDFTLPLLDQDHDGLTLTFTKEGGGILSILPSGSDTIDGLTEEHVDGNLDSLTIRADFQGGVWHFVAGIRDVGDPTCVKDDDRIRIPSGRRLVVYDDFAVKGELIAQGELMVRRSSQPTEDT